MKQKQYYVEQMIAMVKQHEFGRPADDIMRKLSVYEVTYFDWEREYRGLKPAEVRGFD